VYSFVGGKRAKNYLVKAALCRIEKKQKRPLKRRKRSKGKCQKNPQAPKIEFGHEGIIQGEKRAKRSKQREKSPYHFSRRTNGAGRLFSRAHKTGRRGGSQEKGQTEEGNSKKKKMMHGASQKKYTKKSFLGWPIEGSKGGRGRPVPGPGSY